MRPVGHRANGLAGAVVALGLAGCAAAPPLRFDRAAAPDVRTILVLPARFPQPTSLYAPGAMPVTSSWGDVFAAAGLGLAYGGLVAAGPTRRVAAVSQGQERVAEETYFRAIRACLQAEGNAVLAVPVDAGRTWDAYLTTTVTAFGYYPADPLFHVWKPLLRLQATLTRQADQVPLMDVRIVLNTVGSYDPARAEILPGEPSERVRVAKDDPASAQRLLDALQSAVARAAQRVCADLR